MNTNIYEYWLQIAWRGSMLSECSDMLFLRMGRILRCPTPWSSSTQMWRVEVSTMGDSYRGWEKKLLLFPSNVSLPRRLNDPYLVMLNYLNCSIMSHFYATILLRCSVVLKILDLIVSLCVPCIFSVYNWSKVQSHPCLKKMGQLRGFSTKLRTVENLKLMLLLRLFVMVASQICVALFASLR